MQIRVLGPTAIDGAGELPARDRRVLAALVVMAGRACPAERVAAAVYGEEPPASWRKVVQGAVVRLRRQLGALAIETTPAGYALTVGDDQIDARRFERLLQQARELEISGDAERAGVVLEEALALFRGDPLVDLDGWEPGRAEAVRLSELRLLAEEQALEDLLESGHHREAVATAATLAEQQPLRERRWCLLAVAQYRAGRQGDALRSITRARRVLIDELGIGPGEELVGLEQAILAQDPALGHGSAASLASEVCPFKGLAGYDLADADDFFGRERAVQDCLARLAATGFVAVVGPSGCGKSSLARAGIAPALRRPGRGVAIIRPGARPTQALADAPATDALVVDQIEELFTLCDDPAERTAFVAALLTRSTAVPVVVTLRSDHLASIVALPALTASVEAGIYLLPPMTEDDLRAAIEGPATRAGLRLEPGLVELLVRDVIDQPGALPLLSHALTEIWARRDGRVLTAVAYREVGGVRGAVGQSAEAAIDGLPPKGRRIARELFLRLVTVTDGEPVRQRLPRGDLSVDTQHVVVLDALTRARLLTVDADCVQVAHEALTRAWPRLQTWLDEDREGQRVLMHLTSAAKAWKALGGDDAELYRGARLRATDEWVGATHPSLTASEREFLDTSLAHQRAEELDIAAQAKAEAATSRRLRRLLAAVGVMLVLALLAAVASVRATAQADTAARRAEIARLSQLASSLPPKQVDLALLLGVEVHRLRAGADTEGALESALQHVPPGLETSIGSTSGAFPDVSADGRLLAEPVDDNTIELVDLGSGDVTRVKTPPHPRIAVFDKSARRLAIGTSDGVLSIADVATAQQSGAPIDAGGGSVSGMWDPTDDTKLYSIGDSGEITRWDLHDPDHPQRVGDPFVLPAAQPDIPMIVSLSPDGRLLAASANAYQDNESTTVWDVATHAQLRVLPGTVAAFEPDNSTLVLSAKTAVTFSDARTSEQRHPPIEGLTSANLVVLSADNERLAVNDDQQQIKVFDLHNNALAAVLDTPALPIRFLPDGRLLTVDQAHAAFWNIDDRSGPLSTTLGGNPDDVVQARFTGNDTAVWALGLVTSSRSTFWDAASGTTLGSLLPPDTVVQDVSRDGRLAVAAEPSGSIALFDLGNGEPMSTIETAGGDVQATLSPNGQLLAIQAPSTGAQHVPLWDISDPHDPRLLTTIAVPGTLPPGVPSSLSVWFGPGGHEAAIADEALGAITLVDVDRQQVRWTKSPGGAFREAAFTPDGSTLAIGNLYGGQTTLRFFDTQSGDERRSLSVGQTFGVTYARGGSIFVTTGVLAGSQGGAQLWDAATYTPIGEPLQVNGDIATFDDASADGTRVMAGTPHGRITIWDLDSSHWEAAACAIAGRNLSRAEWKDYLPDERYRSTCSQWAPGT